MTYTNLYHYLFVVNPGIFRQQIKFIEKVLDKYLPIAIYWDEYFLVFDIKYKLFCRVFYQAGNS